jgi:hypothetical protein
LESPRDGPERHPNAKAVPFKRSIRAVFTGFSHENRKHWAHNPSVCDLASIVRSKNSTIKEMQDFAKSFVIEKHPDDPSNDPFFIAALNLG